MTPFIEEVKKTVRTNRRIAAAVLIACSIPLITYLDHSTPSNQPLHSIYVELHHIPLLLAALIFRFQGRAPRLTAAFSPVRCLRGRLARCLFAPRG